MCPWAEATIAPRRGTSDGSNRFLFYTIFIAKRTFTLSAHQPTDSHDSYCKRIYTNMYNFPCSFMPLATIWSIWTFLGQSIGKKRMNLGLAQVINKKNKFILYFRSLRFVFSLTLHYLCHKNCKVYFHSLIKLRKKWLIHTKLNTCVL